MAQREEDLLEPTYALWSLAEPKGRGSWADRGPCFCFSTPPSPRCCQGTEARGLVGADGGQGLSDDSNLLTSTKERLQACCPELPTRPEAKASISPSPGSQLIF